MDITGKNDLRHLAMVRRKELENKDELSQEILNRLTGLAVYQTAQNVVVYVSVRTEVRTWKLIESRLEQAMPVFIPYCRGDDLKLFRLQDEKQLARGAFGINEPLQELRSNSEHHISIEEAEMIVVPGVAFDRSCRRLGYGKGYFDRLLANAQPQLTKIGLAFECQIFDAIPFNDHDIAMDYVLTESTQFSK